MSRETEEKNQRPAQKLKKPAYTLLVFSLAVLIVMVSVQCGAPARDVAAETPPSVSTTFLAPETPSAPPPSLSSAEPAASPAAPEQESSVTIPPEEPPSPPDKPVLPEYAALYGQNPDFVGWLSIEGTPIDYPVMYTPEAHDYYLSHNFRKQKDKNGLLVLQADCDPYTPGTNLIIHGHNMKSGKMFGTLDDYKKKAYWQKHRTIRFDTLYERGEYEIVAVFLSKVYKDDEDAFKYYEFTNAVIPDEFDGFIRSVKSLSLYDTGVEAAFGDKLITLSTCSYHTKDGRLAVVARKAG